jgi:predicted transposase YbfD/YdcC
MDTAEYRTLVDALGAVPDPRQRRGRRYSWELLLVLSAAAVVSGQTHVRGIGQWVREHADEVRDLLDRPGQRLPSEATLRRAIRSVDPVAFERCVGRFGETTAARLATGPDLRGLALDGKEVRGARAHGRVVHLLGLASHDGVLLAQTEVADHANEIAAAPALLGGRDLTGTVTTTDALLTQRALARQIRAQGGHYLMVVKDNHPELAGAIAHLFAAPPWLPAEQPAEYAVVRTIGKGHGRLETRTLEASPTLNAWLDWPDVG